MARAAVAACIADASRPFPRPAREMHAGAEKSGGFPVATSSTASAYWLPFLRPLVPHTCMTRAAPPSHRPFDAWEKAIIGDAEILLDPVVVARRPARMPHHESPPVLDAVVAQPPEQRAEVPTEAPTPAARAAQAVPAIPVPAQAPTPVYEEQSSLPAVRRRGRWRRLLLTGLALTVIAFVGLVWLGKQKAPEPVVVSDAQELPPSFEAPIKLPPKVAPVTEHRPDQLDEAASGAAPADILAQATAAPPSIPAGPGIPATAARSPAAPILPPAILVPRTGGAGPVPAQAAEQPLPAPKKSTTRILVPPSTGASGPAGLFAIGSPSARAASSPSKADPKSEAASEGVMPPIAAPIAAPTAAPAAPITSLPDSSGIRRAAYGRSGIVALTADSVIVYDRERRIQTEVRQGGTLPDGSKVLSVQPKRHRIETDHGILELSAPTSN